MQAEGTKPDEKPDQAPQHTEHPTGRRQAAENVENETRSINPTSSPRRPAPAPVSGPATRSRRGRRGHWCVRVSGVVRGTEWDSARK